MPRTNQGFPMGVVVRTVIGEDTDLNHPCIEGTMHDFKDGMPIQKVDPVVEEGVPEGTVESVVYQKFYCRYCLLHIHVEVQRVRHTSNQYSMFDGDSKGERVQ